MGDIGTNSDNDGDSDDKRKETGTTGVPTSTPSVPLRKKKEKTPKRYYTDWKVGKTRLPHWIQRAQKRRADFDRKRDEKQW